MSFLSLLDSNILLLNPELLLYLLQLLIPYLSLMPGNKLVDILYKQTFYIRIIIVGKSHDICLNINILEVVLYHCNIYT